VVTHTQTKANTKTGDSGEKTENIKTGRGEGEEAQMSSLSGEGGLDGEPVGGIIRKKERETFGLHAEREENRGSSTKNSSLTSIKKKTGEEPKYLRSKEGKREGAIERVNGGVEKRKRASALRAKE